jgi:hypothetical protein
MTNTVKDVLGRELTANHKAFQAWLLKESGLTFKSEAAKDAFLVGASLGVRTYSIYQTSKPTSKAAQAKAAAPKPDATEALKAAVKAGQGRPLPSGTGPTTPAKSAAAKRATTKRAPRKAAAA